MRRKLRRLKPIPKFSSRKEEREFWETHDTTEYFDEESLVKLAPHIKDVKLIHVYVAPDGSRWIMIPEDMKKRKVHIANSTRTAFLAAN
jgi:transposase